MTGRIHRKHAAESLHDDAVSGTENKLKQILVQVKYYQSIGKDVEGHDRGSNTDIHIVYIYVFQTSEKREKELWIHAPITWQEVAQNLPNFCLAELPPILIDDCACADGRSRFLPNLSGMYDNPSAAWEDLPIGDKRCRTKAKLATGMT